MRKLLIAFAFVVLVTACATERLNIADTGQITTAKIAQITKGTTTRKEVEAVFGAPLDKLPMKGMETWFYKDFNLRSLWIAFDGNGVAVELLSDN